MSTTEDLLRRTLHDRAERTTYEPTRVEDVATRARFVQRQQRRTAGLAVAAAVAAVAVPVGLVLGTDSERTPEPAPAPSPSVTLPPLGELPQGDVPRVDYVDDRTYVAADGTRTDLPLGEETGLSAIAPYGGGFLVTTQDLGAGSTSVSWVDADGETRWTRCGSDQVAVSGDGRVVGYAIADEAEGCGGWESPLLTWARADAPGVLGELVTTTGELVDPVAVTDEEMVYNATDVKTGQPAGVFITPLLGPPTQVPGLGLATAFDPDSRTLAGMDLDGVGVLVDVDTGDVRVSLEKSRVPLALSPDGSYVVSAVFTADGDAPAEVHDVTTGTEVLAVAAPEPNATQASPWAVTWEDDTHLLVGTLTTRQQAIVRIGLDGSVELATQPGRETLAGFMFPGRT